MTEGLGALVREEWATLMAEGFEIVEEDRHLVLLRSSNVSIRAVHDPRGEVDIDVYPTGIDRLYGWHYAGVVGRASVGRLLELALAQMRSEPEIAQGDAGFYDALALRCRRCSLGLSCYRRGRWMRTSRFAVAMQN